MELGVLGPFAPTWSEYSCFTVDLLMGLIIGCCPYPISCIKINRLYIILPSWNPKGRKSEFWNNILSQRFLLRDCGHVQTFTKYFLLLKHFEVKCYMCVVFYTHNIHWDYIWIHWNIKSSPYLNTLSSSHFDSWWPYTVKNELSGLSTLGLICCLFLPTVIKISSESPM